MAKQPPVYQHSPGLAASKPALKNPPTVIPPGRIVGPGSAAVPEEPGMGSGAGGTGAPTPPPPAAPSTPETPPTPPGDSAIDPTQFAADWYKAFFQQYGLPADVQGTVLYILKQYASDPATAQALAQQYLRTTDWYQQTFPGIAAGQRNGLFTDETGYRSYLNAVNQLFNQYLGRHVTSDELSGYLASGYAPAYVGNLLQGQAWAGANGRDVRQLTGAFGDNGQISDTELAALGNEHAGIDTAQGQSIDAIVARAQQRLQTIFNGKLATPGGLTLGATGLAAAAGLGGKTTPDVGA